MTQDILPSNSAVMSRARESKVPSAISVLCKACLGRYSTLCDGLDASTLEQALDTGFDQNASLDLMEDARSRFKAWAVSITALQGAHFQSSLDFRLKEATEIRRRIVKILTDLEKSLHEGQHIFPQLGNFTNIRQLSRLPMEQCPTRSGKSAPSAIQTRRSTTQPRISMTQPRKARPRPLSSGRYSRRSRLETPA